MLKNNRIKIFVKSEIRYARGNNSTREEELNIPSSIFPTSFPECAIIFLYLIILGGCDRPYSLSLNMPLAIKRLGKGNVRGK